MNDVIERIGRLDIYASPSQSVEQYGPSKKDPSKWLTKTLEIVCNDEIGKKWMRIYTKKNGGDVDDSDSAFDIDASYDFELIFSTNLKRTSFKEVASRDE